MKSILLAIGNAQYSEILRKHLSRHDTDFHVLDQEVMHRRYLEEVVDLERPDILILHDYYLPTELQTQEEREEEWLSFIQKIREHYDDSIRVVFLCEREKGDPFLSDLVSINVLDIFNKNAIDIVQLIDQLKDKPRFSRVSKLQAFQKAKPIIQVEEEDELTEEIEEEKPQEEKGNPTKENAPSPKERPEKPVKQVVQKVVQKKVNVINKQVVKRDYNVQILNQVEKVVGVPIEKKLVLVGSYFSRSGSTFISHLLARELAKMGVSVTYIESPYSNAYSYDRFIGHELTPHYRSKFYQFTKEIDPKKASVFEWEFKDVNMVVKHPENEPIYSTKEVPFDVFTKILFASPSVVTIVDIGSDWGMEIYQDIFDIASCSYCVIEPDISNIQFIEDPDNLKTFAYRELVKDNKSFIIGNRFEPSLLKNQLIDDLYKGKLHTLIPEIPSSDVFQSHFKGEFVNDHPKYKATIHEALMPMIRDLLPKEFLKKQQGHFFKGMFNKKISLSKSE